MECNRTWPFSTTATEEIIGWASVGTWLRQLSPSKPVGVFQGTTRHWKLKPILLMVANWHQWLIGRTLLIESAKSSFTHVSITGFKRLSAMAAIPKTTGGK